MNISDIENFYSAFKLIRKTMWEYRNDFVSSLRHDIIFKGKRLPKFIKLGKQKKRTNEKYINPDNLDDSGSITDMDALYLYLLVKTINPKTVIEIGTWFGTSAVVMASAFDGKVMTCDFGDLYVKDNPCCDRIVCYQKESTGFLKKMIKNEIYSDFIFVDATLRKEDFALLKKVSTGLIAIHDFGYFKGKSNVIGIRKAIHGKVYNPPIGSLTSVFVPNTINNKQEL
jgi:hypothetical protein